MVESILQLSKTKGFKVVGKGVRKPHLKERWVGDSNVPMLGEATLSSKGDYVSLTTENPVPSMVIGTQ